MVLALPLGAVGHFATWVEQRRARPQYSARVSCCCQHGNPESGPQPLWHAFAQEHRAGDAICIDVQVHMSQLAGGGCHFRDGVERLFPCADGLHRDGQYYGRMLAQGLDEQGIVKGILFVLFGEQDVQPDGCGTVAAYLVQQFGMERPAPGPPPNDLDALFVNGHQHDVRVRRAVLQSHGGVLHQAIQPHRRLPLPQGCNQHQ